MQSFQAEQARQKLHRLQGQLDEWKQDLVGKKSAEARLRTRLSEAQSNLTQSKVLLQDVDDAITHLSQHPKMPDEQNRRIKRVLNGKLTGPHSIGDLLERTEMGFSGMLASEESARQKQRGYRVRRAAQRADPNFVGPDNAPFTLSPITEAEFALGSRQFEKLTEEEKEELNRYFHEHGGREPPS